MNEYSVDAVRDAAGHTIGIVSAMLTAYAERIKADEGVVPVAKDPPEPLRPGYVKCLQCDAQIGGYGYGEFPKLCPVCQNTSRAPAAEPAQAAQVDVYEAYKTWPDDIREKLSLHDLRRMGGWEAKSPVSDWRIDTSAGRPILCYQDCSVIESEQARYVINLISVDQNHQPAAEPVAQGDPNIPTALDECRLQLIEATEERDHLRAALAAQPRAVPAERRSTHAVWRREEWLPCYCEAASDHPIGAEVLTKPAERVVDGWVLVPRELSTAMTDAACRLTIATDQGTDTNLDPGEAVEMWQAVLAAAPQTGESA